MKIKGISFFEQHIEKFVLLGTLAVAMFFGAMQFLGTGNTVDIGGKTLTAAEVDDELQRRAEDIRARLADGAPPTITPPLGCRTCPDM